ncbi:hypothetical protein D3C80_351650 [compost metagenome]
MIKFAQSVHQFVLDVKIGADLGYDWPTAVRDAWKMWGWRAERAEIVRRVDRVIDSRACRRSARPV